MAQNIIHCSEDPTFEPDFRGMGVYFLEKLRANKYKIGQIDGITGKKQTYEEMMWKSIRLAQHLQEKGITTEDIITLCASNSLDTCLPYLAALYLGVRFSGLDPTLSVEDCVHLLNLVKPKFLFCDKDSLKLMVTSLKTANLKTEIIIFDDTTTEYTSFSELITTTGTEDEFEAQSAKNLNDTVVIFFSSGTTGLPKGICTTHYGLLSKWTHQDNGSIKNKGVVRFATNSMIFTTFYWISAIFFFNGAIINGTQRIICKHFSPKIFFNAVEQHKISIAFLSPFQISNIITHPEASSYDLSTISCIAVGGTSVSETHLMALQKLLPNCIIHNGYGITETQGIAIFFNLEEDAELMSKKLGSIGKPLPGFSYKVVNPDTEEILGPNENGELRMKGRGLMKGYYNDPEATAAVFDKNGFLKTGDIVYYDEDHCFYFVDRIKEMFKFRSWHILPLELETILLTHVDIKEASVVGIPHHVDGDHPMAAIVLKSNATAKASDILIFFNNLVPDRKKLRAGVKIMDSLPYTPTGKIRRNYLRQILINEFKK